MDVTVLSGGLGFAEGPVHRRAGDVLITSIDHGRLYGIKDGASTVLATLGGGPNGATEGRDGSIYVAQNGGKWPGQKTPDVTGGIQVLRPDGSIAWVTMDPVSPNDLCIGPDGLLYATDPTRPLAKSDGRIWRIDVATGEAELLVSVASYPNGIAFGLEDDAVYVALTAEGQIIRYPITASGLGKADVVVQMDHGHPDGFAFDCKGNLVVAAVSFGERPGDVQTWTINGELLDVLQPGSSHFYTNVALGEDRTLVITDADGGTLLGVPGWPYAGLPLHPFRRR